MSRSMRRTDRSVWAATSLMVSLLVGCGRDSSAASVAPSRPTFAVASPRLTDTSFEREYVGEVQAVRYAEIRSRLKGLIESVAVDEGQTVKSGQQLLSLAAGELQQELLKARAATKSAEAELKLTRLEQENTKMLFEKKVVSSAEMALADSKVEALLARVEESKANGNQMAISLTYAKVRAPFDGVVNRIPHKVGSVVSEDDLLTTITDTSEVLVYFRVSEREYLEYASAPDERSKDISLKLVDGTAYPSRGAIDAVESEVSRETGNLAFRARFPNPDRLLRHGSSAKVVVRTSLQGALLVPQKSTFEVQGRIFVYSLDAENTTRAREIVSKQRVGDSFVVASGLTVQDRFILEGVQKVKEGTRIDPIPPS